MYPNRADRPILFHYLHNRNSSLLLVPMELVKGIETIVNFTPMWSWSAATNHQPDTADNKTEKVFLTHCVFPFTL